MTTKYPTKVDLGPKLNERQKRAGYMKLLGVRYHREPDALAKRRAKYREKVQAEREKRDKALAKHNQGIPDNGSLIMQRLQAQLRSNALKGRYDRNVMWKKRLLDGCDPLVALYEIAFDPQVDPKVRSYAAAEVRDTIYGKMVRPSISEKAQTEVNVAIANWANGTESKGDPIDLAQTPESDRS